MEGKIQAVVKVLPIMGLWCLALIGCFIGITGCRSVPQNPTFALGEEADVEPYPDDQILEAVKKWYRERGIKEPSRVIVKSKTPTSYIVIAGHPLRETGFKVDPRTGQILETYPIW